MNPLYPETGQMPQGMGQAPQDMGMAQIQNQAAAPRSPQGGGGGMSQGDQARLFRWQEDLKVAQKAAQAPRQPNENPEQFKMRQRDAYEQLRQLQMTKPTGYNVSKGQMGNGQPQRPAPQGGAAKGGLYEYLAKMIGGGQ